MGALPFSAELDITAATPDLVDVSTCIPSKSVWYGLDLEVGDKVFINTEGSNFSTTITIFEPGPLPTRGSCSTTSERFFSPTIAGTHRVRIGSNATGGSQILKLLIYEVSELTGKVVDDLGQPLAEARVYLDDADDWYYWESVLTAADGTYAIRNVRRGRFRLSYWANGHLYRYYHNADRWVDAAIVEPMGGPIELLDQILPREAVITGTVAIEDGSSPQGCVSAYHQDGTGEASAYMDEDGVFVLDYLPAGTYDLVVSETCGEPPLGTFKSEWYQDASGPDTATPITVMAGDLLSGVEILTTPTDVPANDNFAGATDLGTLPASIAQGLSRATAEPSDPQVCGISGKTVWYKYTAIEDEELHIGSWQVRSGVALHKIAGGGELSLVGCTQRTYYDYTTTFNLERGATYMLQVGAVGGAATAGISMSLLDSEGHGAFTFTPKNPCHIQCPYWNQQRTREQKNEDACAPEPAAPEGSWEDYRLDVPETINGKIPYSMTFTMDPETDHDVWFCRVEPEDDNYLVTYAANSPTQACDNRLPLGCTERFTASVTPGKSYVIRVYNWSDVGPVEGEWWYHATKAAAATGGSGSSG